jgi:hypothetical protein
MSEIGEGGSGPGGEDGVRISGEEMGWMYGWAELVVMDIRIERVELGYTCSWISSIWLRSRGMG